MIRTNHPGMHYDKKQKTFLVEVSQLQLSTIPKTIELQSQWTNNVRSFTLYQTRIDSEGDTTAWEYRSDGLTLIIIND